MLRTLLLLFALTLPTALFADAAPVPSPGGDDWLASVANEVSDLVNTNADSLVEMGNIELSVIALYMLIAMVCRWQLAHMVVGNRPVNFNIGDLFIFMLQLSACMLMLSYYNSPLPGTSVKFHQIFSYVGFQVAQIFDSTVLNEFLEHINEAQAKTQAPGLHLDFFGIVLYDLVYGALSILRAVSFTVDSAGFIFNGLVVLFGPLLIPLYMTRRFASKFWHWLDGLLFFGMWRAVSAGLSFIWWSVFNTFFTNTLNKDYTLGHWLQVFPILVLLMFACLWSTFQVPMITSWIFGGFSGAQAATDAFSSVIQKAVKAAV